MGALKICSESLSAQEFTAIHRFIRQDAVCWGQFSFTSALGSLQVKFYRLTERSFFS
jgi:hypothetical protein